MADLLQRFIRLLDCSDRRNLKRQIEFLEVQNEILRSCLPEQVRLSETARAKIERWRRRYNTIWPRSALG